MVQKENRHTMNNPVSASSNHCIWEGGRGKEGGRAQGSGRIKALERTGGGRVGNGVGTGKRAAIETKRNDLSV